MVAVAPLSERILFAQVVQLKASNGDLRKLIRLLQASGTGIEHQENFGPYFRMIRFLDGCCRWCMRSPAETVDHVIPKAKGGTNHPHNLVGCCRRCNKRKADKLPKEIGWVLHVPQRFYL